MTNENIRIIRLISKPNVEMKTLLFRYYYSFNFQENEKTFKD